jgi:hypothetical protein
MKILAGILLAPCLAGISMTNAGDDDEEGLIKTEMEFHQTIEVELEYGS